MKIRKLFTYTLLCTAIAQPAAAAVFSFPENPSDTVISQFADDVPLTQAEEDETLLDIARRFSLGQMEIVRLNPDVDRWNVKKGEIVRLPNYHILPDAPREGLVLNIAEYRMYYFPPAQEGEARKIYSFANGVGRQDWKTPLGRTTVAKKVKDPVWRPPESIRREHAAMGDPLPEVVPAGPHNPLGQYALYLNLPGDYRIHGTDIDKIFGIGMQITHGCMRMYPEDIEQLYNLVPVGSPVHLVKQPIKVGWLKNHLYVEAHPDLEGEELTPDQRYQIAVDLIQKNNNGILPEFNEAALKEALVSLSGIPVPIFERIEMPPTLDTTQEAQNSISEPSATATPEMAPSVATPAPIAKPAKKIPPASPLGYYSPKAAQGF